MAPPSIDRIRELARTGKGYWLVKIGGGWL